MSLGVDYDMQWCSSHLDTADADYRFSLPGGEATSAPLARGRTTRLPPLFSSPQETEKEQPQSCHG
jgi:hypothetical protein